MNDTIFLFVSGMCMAVSFLVIVIDKSFAWCFADVVPTSPSQTKAGLGTLGSPQALVLQDLVVVRHQTQ